jgi:hypothetical protein
MPESDQRVSVSPSGDDGAHPFSSENRVKSARASFPQVEAPHSLSQCEEIFRGLSQGRQRAPVRRLGLGSPGASLKLSGKTRVSIASAAPNLRDARDCCVIYITK